MKEISEALESALIAYLEGEATLQQIESLHEWAGLDPENAELLYGLKHLYAERNATSKIEAVDVETMRHRLLARPEFASEERIAALRPAPRRKLWRKIWFRAVGYAASAAALIAVGVLVGKSGGTVISDSFNTICVDAGSKSRIVLADGTQVTMKASSKLRYPASFGSGPREVWLDGEAYFDVEHDAEHPFIVHSCRQSVRVLGTTFNVQAYSNESENTVTLLSGAVGLDLLDREGELFRSLELHPYEQCHFDKRAGSYRLSELDAYERQVPWDDGVYRFRDQSLAQIAARLQNYYGVRILLIDEAAEKIRYTGSFSLTERLDEVFGILNHDGRLHIERNGNTYRIRLR